MSSVQSRDGRPPPTLQPLDDPDLLFRRLEQADIEEAGDIKELFRDNLRLLTGEAWLLNGLIDYYVSTGSARCLEILLSCGDGNSRALIDRLHQLLKSADQRGAGLRLLGYYVRKHPVWLRKVVTQSSPSIVKDLFRIIKAECEMQCIISAALVLTTLMPMFPVALIDHIQDLFQVLSRLTQMVSTTSAHLGQTYRLHLHVATYSYFVRIYAMYPCNLLSFLRQHYGQRDNLPLFNRTIRPLLDHVRMHPLLVTGSNSTETSAQRWQRKETHDIVAECAHFSLDVLEASPMDNLSGPLWAPPAVDSSDTLGPTDVGLDCQEPFGIHDILWSPAAFCSVQRPPAAEPDVLPGPCETAVEATPDTTPAATPTVTPQRDLETPPLMKPPSNSVQVSRALTSLVGAAKPRADSIPSSPLKRTPAAFRFGDSELAHTFTSRLGQVLHERTDTGGGDPERRAADECGAAGRPASTMTGLRDRRTSGKLSPIKLKLGVVSPVQFSEGAPPVTRPVPRASDANGQPWRGPPTGGGSSGGGGGSGGGHTSTPGHCSSLWHEVSDHSAEDLEVSDLTRHGSAAAAPAGSLTPFASTTAQLTQQHPLRQLATAPPTAIPGRATAEQHGDDNDNDDDDGDDVSPPPAGQAASVPQSRFDFDLVRHMTRYYSRHVLPGRQYRRTSSCPDLAAEQTAAAAAAPVLAASGPRSDASCQTEDSHHPAPYEHLLTGALPPAPAAPQVSTSPHQLLRQHMTQVGPNARLLHELLQYERYKREVHAHRNRRLFDRTRATRRLEEENRELKKQVQTMSVDVAECHRQLQLVKRQAARAADEHRAAARRLEEQAAEDGLRREQLAAQLEEQRLAAGELASQLAERDAQTETMRRELLETGRELSCAQEKAIRKVELEGRVLELERRLLMIGQLRQAAAAAAAASPDPAAGGDPWAQLETAEPTGGRPDDAQRRAEAVACGLEEQLRERDLCISELRRLMETVRMRHHEQLQTLQERYSVVKEHLQAAETRLLLCPPPEPAGYQRNGATAAAPPGKAARTDTGPGDLRATIGGAGD